MKFTTRMATATTLTCILLGAGAIVLHVNTVINMINMQNNDRGISIAHSLGSKIQEHVNKSTNEIVLEYTESYLYPKILVFDKKDNLICEASKIDVKKIAPIWFTKIFVNNIKPVIVSESNWQLINTVELQFNKDTIAAIVWDCTKLFVYYYIGLLLVALFVQYLIMNNFRQIVQAAKMINQRNFNLNKMHTNAQDLKELVNLVNYLPNKVHSVFQGQVALNNLLKVRIVLNNSSKLHNKWFFEAQLQHLLNSSKAAHGGYLVYFIVNHLKLPTDLMFKEISDLSSQYSIALSAHFDDDVFALALLNSSLVSLEELISDLQNRLYAKNIGVVKFAQDSYKDDICNRAYVALKQSQGSREGFYIDDQAISVGQVVNNWEHFLSSAISQKSLLLSYQPVYLYRGGNVDCLHYEVVMQLLAPNKILLGMSNFLPYVEHLGLSFDLIRLEIEHVLEHIADNFNANHRYSIKISESLLVASEVFINYLSNIIYSYKFPSLLRKITFEFSESAVNRHYQDAFKISHFCLRNNIGFAVEHFGINPGSFEFMHNLHLRYLKIDGSYTKEIEKNYDHQVMIKSFVELAHGLDIPAIATHVDTKMEQEVLLQLGVDGMQGLFVGLGIR